MNLVSLPRNSFNLQNSLSLNYKGVHSTSPVLPPFFYVLCSFCLSSCSQTKEKLGNTQTCFKNTYVLDQPQTSWSNWSRHYPGIAIFQSSLGDPNAQPGWGATGHPFSSVNLPDSPFLPVPKLMTKSRSWKWESSRCKCPRPETPSGRMRRERPLDTCDFCHCFPSLLCSRSTFFLPVSLSPPSMGCGPHASIY